MRQRQVPFKDTQVFGWETEPAPERPSEFVPTTGFSSLSGYYAMPPAKVHRRGSRRSALTTWMLAAAVLGIAMFGLLMLVHSLKA